MEKVLLIKYGELTTKKGNRNFFIKSLRQNIKSKLSDFKIGIIDDYYRMFIYVHESDFEKVIDTLKCISGIHEIVVAYRLDENDRNMDAIKNLSLEIMNSKEFLTFKVETNRSDKTYPGNSIEISREIGAHILRNIPNIKVDVKNPEVLLDIEIRQEGVYISTDAIKGLGGYPVGTGGKALLMLSGGIDSPVAGYLTLKKGIRLDYIYFESMPHTSIEARNKVIELAKIINKYNFNSKIFIVNFTEIQEAIYKNLKEEYLITLMRRMMYRIAERVSLKYKSLAIVNGESIGQVASQTLSSIRVVNEVTDFPIIRPLAIFDKNEIIEISKTIGTYETSILPFEDCCTIFVPKHPVINPNLETAKTEEMKIDFERMLDKAVETIEIIKLDEQENIKEEEYL